MTDPLVERARQGDRASMEALLARVAPAIHRFGMRMCKSPSDADDVLQDTLLTVATHLGSFEERASLTSWVFALARSACVRRRRGLKNKAPVSDDLAPEQPDAGPSPEAVTSDHELAAALHAALGQLSEDHREVIVLRDLEGLSAPDAAAALGISVDALKSRLHRAREALRVALKPALEPQVEAAAGGCPDVVAMWSAKLEGDLSPVDCASMESHIARCPACAGACGALRRALVVCQQTTEAQVPPEVQRRVKAALRQWTGSAREP